MFGKLLCVVPAIESRNWYSSWQLEGSLIKDTSKEAVTNGVHHITVPVAFLSDLCLNALKPCAVLVSGLRKVRLLSNCQSPHTQLNRMKQLNVLIYYPILGWFEEWRVKGAEINYE